jgi:hypothetical protein
MKQPSDPRPPHDEPKPAPPGIDQEDPVPDRAGRTPAPEPKPSQKGGADDAAASTQVPENDPSLAPESGDKLGGGPAGR